MMKRYLIPILMIAVLLSAMLAACGSDKEDDAEKQSGSKASETASVIEEDEGELPRIAIDGGDSTDASEGKNSGGSVNQNSGEKQSSDNGSSSKGSSDGDSGKGSDKGSGDKSGNSSGDKSGKDKDNGAGSDSGKTTSPTTADKDKNEPTVPSEISQYIEENGDDELPFVPA